jgi:ketosteroid isomerase-like protein
MDGSPPPLLRDLLAAMNAHDLDALTACFAADYVNETPVHPTQGFTGREQVRRNWARILGSVPDLAAVLVRWAVGPEGAQWAEWDWRGTRPDGVPVHLRGVTVLGAVPDGPGGSGGEVAGWARFYMEPVETTGGDADAGVTARVGGVR